ncbi:rCG25900 [Rattus norvegicus]|uniref:RCG25900 n=1 Tax=Rattus norvegicus TaxID=10116 RepID=A6I2T5_RAT|nr:rCG25900 [Rattus norvegicus]
MASSSGLSVTELAGSVGFILAVLVEVGAVLGNGTLLVVVLRTPDLQDAFYLAHLCVVDLLAAASIMPLGLLAAPPGLGSVPLDPSSCRAARFLSAALLPACTLGVAALGLARYRLIVHPLRPGARPAPALVLTAVWSAAALLGALSLLGPPPAPPPAPARCSHLPGGAARRSPAPARYPAPLRLSGQPPLLLALPPATSAWGQGGPGPSLGRGPVCSLLAALCLRVFGARGSRRSGRGCCHLGSLLRLRGSPLSLWSAAAPGAPGAGPPHPRSTTSGPESLHTASLGPADTPSAPPGTLQGPCPRPLGGTRTEPRIGWTEPESVRGHLRFLLSWAKEGGVIGHIYPLLRLWQVLCTH